MSSAGLDVLALAVIEAQVIVVAGDRPKDVIPDDLVGHVWIIRINQREWLASYITNHAAMVLTQAYLTRILLRRVFVGGRPVHPLGRRNMQLHPLLNHV